MGYEGSSAYQRGELTVIILKNKLVLVELCVMGLVFGGSYSFSRADSTDAQKSPAVIVAPAADDDAADDDQSTADMSSHGIRDRRKDGVNENGVNFNIFLTSGYAANDISGIPSVGKVSGTTELDGSLSTAKTLYVDVPSGKIKLEPGEKLIVFGDGGPLREKNSGFNKRFIKNLAILKVREAEGKRYLADVLTSYDDIPLGSPVKLYSGEKQIWDKAQVAKEFPTHSITCYVVGGERGRDYWLQTDYVILTAGTKQGVVEGLNFQLREILWDKNVKSVGVARGSAKVFYAGSSYSIARIQMGSGAIYNGFEAIYNP